MSCEKIKLVTSVNGETGDVVIKWPDASNFYTKTEADIMFNNKADKTDFNELKNEYESFVEEQGVFNQATNESINALDGLKANKTDFNELKNEYESFVEAQETLNSSQTHLIEVLENSKADKTDIPDVSIYNPTNNFKTINKQSIIGTGNIHIEGGGGGGDDKMDKTNPIFTEYSETDEINPEFRLHDFIEYRSFYGVYNDDCVERFHTTENLWVEWYYPSISVYINENTATQYAAVKGFCRVDGPEYGQCKYHLYISGKDGSLTNIDQYMLDTHVYGALAESTGIQQQTMGVVDSRDPNDNIISMVNNAAGSTYAFYTRKDVTHYTPFSTWDADRFLNAAWEYPYMTSLIDIKSILENYSVDEYTTLRVEIVTDNTFHWHIISTKLFFTNDTDFIIHTESHKEHVLIDTLYEKATKADLERYNPTDNFVTINGLSIIGTGEIHIEEGAVTSVNGQTGDVTIDIPVTSVNGATGDVVIEVPTDYVNNDTFNQFVDNQTVKNQELDNKIGDIDTALTNILGDGL